MSGVKKIQGKKYFIVKHGLTGEKQVKKGPYTGPLEFAKNLKN